MSKIIESLKTKETLSKDAAVSKNANREIRQTRTSRELTQQQLADIYFSATGKNKSSDVPVIIKVVEKPRLASLIPWIIASIAFLITGFSLFSTKRVFVHIRVVDDKAVYARSFPAPAVSSEPVQTIGGRHVMTNVNKISFEEFTYEGAAFLKSSKDAGGLMLVNSSVAPFARAVRHFETPLNLSRAKITFMAKGARGGENVAIALKDGENVQAFYRGKFYPFKGGLTSEWQTAEITPADMTKEFDASTVVSIRFEFGAKDTGNKPGDTVYIKDLQYVSP